MRRTEPPAFEADAVSLGEFVTESGETIPDLTVAYHAHGEFDGSNAVLACHALTGSQHVADLPPSAAADDTAGQARAWWSDVVGPGKAIDTTEYYVVCANVPGSCYGTTGPTSEAPDGDPWGAEFPPVTVGDWTRAQRRLLDELGVGRLHAVVGGSVGGMNVLDWARRFPDDVDRLLPVAAAARLDAQLLGLQAVARRAIRTDPGWQGGEYHGTGDRPKQGLALARQLGHLSYLSKPSMERKFGRRASGRQSDTRPFPPEPGGEFFPYREVESYLDYQAETFASRFDATSYLRLSRAMEEFDLASGFRDDADALAAFGGEALVMSFTADWHFTVDQARSLSAACREAGVPVAHHVVDSDHGHDAFLVEPESVGPPIRDFLVDGVDGRAVTDADDSDDPDDDGDAYAPVHNGLFSA
ncbi:MAG: homoserine O-acetyltransferase [Halolamina sp.]